MQCHMPPMTVCHRLGRIIPLFSSFRVTEGAACFQKREHGNNKHCERKSATVHSRLHQFSLWRHYPKVFDACDWNVIAWKAWNSCFLLGVNSIPVFGRAGSKHVAFNALGPQKRMWWSCRTHWYIKGKCDILFREDWIITQWWLVRKQQLSAWCGHDVESSTHKQATLWDASINTYIHNFIFK